MKCFAISISAGTISTRHRSAKSPRRPLTLTSLDGGFGGRTRDNYLKKGDYFGCKEQHMHRLAWSYKLPKAKVSLALMLRHPSRRRRSLARSGLSRAIVISFWHPIMNGPGSLDDRLGKRGEKTGTPHSSRGELFTIYTQEVSNF